MLNSIPGFFQRAAVIVIVMRYGKNESISDRASFIHCKSFFLFLRQYDITEVKIQTVKTDSLVQIPVLPVSNWLCEFWQIT